MRSRLIAALVAMIAAMACSSDGDGGAASTPIESTTSAAPTASDPGSSSTTNQTDPAPTSTVSTLDETATTTEQPTATSTTAATTSTASVSSSAPPDVAAICRAIYDDAAPVFTSGLDVLDEAWGGLTMDEIRDLPESELDAVLMTMAQVARFDLFDEARRDADCANVPFEASDTMCDTVTDHAAGTTLPAELIDDFLEPLNC